MSKVWVTGDAVVDLIPDTEMTYLKCPGGAPANVAVAISRLGVDSGFFGRVGDDPFGKFLIETLESERVDVTPLKLDPARRTSTVVVDLDDTGERSFTFMVKPSADQFTQPEDIPTFQQGDWLHICSIALANEPARSTTLLAMEKMKQAGGYVSFDPNLRHEVWANQDEIIPTVLKAIGMSDVVKFSDDELAFLTGKASISEGLDSLKTYQLPMILVTQGAKGALLVTEEGKELISGKAVSPVDTTGAGDAFVGGLLSYLAQVEDWSKLDNAKNAVKWANGCGALATTQKGAMTALPTIDALNEFIN
ncbi:aminoimidazole riboside kinase [Vibrio nigripulchritudo]|uniref:aminoimidazole riboside kinase n=1 Tax=Vibrio nigripulchritudo TaxID=28173 RepID=UPI00190D384B|nr:aminoimidazole riboside kinase [Vibrio nigripulchritudo]BCL72692.1 aminoimidazole riboside kinase [Vibrio nigripulchritudo]BDU34051.1 aminoimidazole riboside kinase [Vibrio nigripulchritudo]